LDEKGRKAILITSLAFFRQGPVTLPYLNRRDRKNEDEKRTKEN
jgi:hypothetical protein